MSQIPIDISTPNDGLGDPLRTAFNSVNLMFSELYGSVVFKETGKGLSTNDFNNGISRLERSMSNSSSGSIIADKKGIALWKSENGRRTKVLNNRLHVRK